MCAISNKPYSKHRILENYYYDFFYLKIRILELIKFPYMSFVEKIILVLIGVYKLDCDNENVNSQSSSLHSIISLL